MSIAPCSKPIEVKRTTTSRANLQLGNGLEVSWSTGKKTFFPSRFLRSKCPCASCLEQNQNSSHCTTSTKGRARLNIVKASSNEETNLVSVWSIGNYALGIKWGDNHDSGIYSFEWLISLANSTESTTTNV